MKVYASLSLSLESSTQLLGVFARHFGLGTSIGKALSVDRRINRHYFSIRVYQLIEERTNNFRVFEEGSLDET
jgi:hypothetical protein